MSSDSKESPQQTIVITGGDIGKHPFYQERQKLDTISGHDWLMMLSLGLSCATGFRLGAIALQLAGFPVGLTVFFAVILLGLTLAATKFSGRMPKQLSVVSISASIGFVIGFLA